MSHTATLAPADAFELAMEPMRHRRWAEAATLWQMLRTQFNDHPTPWLQGAISLIRQDDFQGADSLLQHARAQFANHAVTWITSAEWAFLSGDEALEEQFLTTGREQLGNHWHLLYKSAEVALRLGNLELASTFNRQARAHAPERTEPLIQGADLANRRKDWADAEQCWKQAIVLKPESREYLSRLADVYRSMGNFVLSKRYRLAGQYGAELLQDGPEPLQSPNLVNRQKAPWHFLQLVFVKSWLNLKSESSGMRLNHAWVVMEPLLHLMIYYYLFGTLLNAGVENYGLFLLCGLVPWMWFTKAISTSSGSIVSGQSLMLNCSMPPAFFPLVSIVQSTLKQLPPLMILLLLGAATDSKTLSWHLMYLPVVVLAQFMLTAALGMLVAAAVAFLRDLANLVSTGLLMLMFLSGVIYNASALSPGVAAVIRLNPMTLVIGAYRDIIMEGRAPDFAAMGYVGLCTLGAAVLAYVIYRTQRSEFVKRGMV
ncbi:ABC transporter permease [Pseudomonas parasichuanensis]|uniref:ABC transporter permease n=1 Tax=Pseudomonas parasichuanensis TaxID=2892329 RepID=UPI001F2B50EC|nr:ABC transporter permease [Pseudomonas parasichuanensis]